MNKKVFVMIVTNLIIVTLVILAVFNTTIESILGALLLVGGLCMLLIYCVYHITKPIWLEVHKQKELLLTDTNKNTISNPLLSIIKYYDLHEFIGNCSVTSIIRWIVFIVTGFLLNFHLYSRFAIWAANHCIEYLNKILSMFN